MVKLFRRIQALVHREALDADLAEELEDHRARRQAELERSGMSPAEAATASRRALGNVTLAREDARAEWGWSSCERLWRDVRYGARLLRRQPSFAITAILTLAVGIAATTTVFSVVEAELWRPLPFPEPDRLVSVLTTGAGRSGSQEPVSGPDFLDWRSQTRSFEELAAFRWSVRRILRGRTASEPVRVMAVTSNFFTVLQRAPALGRAFNPEDDVTGRVVILSDGAWRRVFDADPRVVGTTISLDDQPYAVAGVMPADGRLEFMAEPDLFMAIALPSIRAGGRGTRDLNAIGRLRDGVTLEKANADLRTVALDLARAYPADHAGRGAWVGDLRETQTGWNARPLLFFLGAAVLVLLLSCANVANLLLARAFARQREFAVRGALGGGRGAILRQLLVEGSLLAVPAAIIGLLLTSWALEGLASWLPPGYLDRGGHLALNARIYFFALASSALTALAFGLAPGLFAVRRDLSVMLTQGGRTIAGSRTERRARHALVVMEVTTALVLLFGAGLFLNSLLRLTDLPLGFDPRDRLTMRVLATGTRYADRQETVRLFARLVDQARAVPGVRDAAVGSSMPLDSGASAFFVRADRPRPASGQEEPSILRTVSPEYFRVLSIRRLAGRDFTSEDVAGAPGVALVNEKLARRVFPGEDPVGKELVLVRSGTDWVRSGPVQIVGVVSNIKDTDMNEVDFNDIYVPLAQYPTGSAQLIVSTAIAPASVVDPLRQAVHALDSGIPVYGISTMAERVENALRGGRVNLLLIGTFATLALVLASVGIYGAMSYAIVQRLPEFGVRLALGARPGEILRLALGQSARLGLVGAALGIGVSLGLARILGNALYLVQGEHGGLIYGVTTTDPVTLTCASVAIVGVAAFAGLAPARRATRVDPIVVLRCD